MAKTLDTTALIPVALCALSTSLFWPGFMSQDPIDQYAQALTGVFNSDHPPIMAVVWRLLLNFGDGPGPMLVFHNAMFWGGMWLIARRAFSSSRWRVTLLILPCLAPPIFLQLGMIWKDVGVSAALVLTLGLLLTAQRSDHPRRYCLAAVTPLFYAIAARHNTVLAAVPFCMWLVAIFRRTDAAQSLRSAAYGLLLTLALFAGSQMFNRAVGEMRTSIFYYSLVGDLTALSLYSNADWRPKFLHNREGLKWRDRHLIFSDSFAILHSIRHWRPDTEEQAQEIRTQWGAAVLRFPTAYLGYRFGLFLDAIGLRHRRQIHAYLEHTYPQPNPFGFVNDGNRVSRAYFAALTGWRQSPLFRGYVYLLVCFACFLASTTGLVQSRVVTLVSASGILYLVPLFFCAPHTDFRYGYWTVIAAVFSSFLAIHEFASRKHFSTTGKRVLLPSRIFESKIKWGGQQ